MTGARGQLLGLAAVGAQTFLVYRANVAFQLLGVLLQISLLKVVWTAVLTESPGASDADVPTVVTYLTIINLQVWLLSGDVARMIHERIRDGSIALDLTRPLGLLSQFTAIQVGRTGGAALLAVVALPLALVLGGLRLPPSWAAGLMYLVSLALAYWISVLISLLLGLIAFWTFETTGVFAIHRFVNAFLGGALVPLWLFPEWLWILASVLPFQAVGYIPVAIYLGRVSEIAAAAALLVQVVWVIILSVAARRLWARAVVRVTVQGG